ncbi:MAG: hypothetical protein RLY97_1022, partial [Pseudomonadota bacterium]
RAMDAILGSGMSGSYTEAHLDIAAQWPEIGAATAAKKTHVRVRFAPDRTPIITAATKFGADGQILFTMRNPRDITQAVRDARQTLVFVVGGALAVSVMLSLFLARTIVKPLRQLVRAAVRVRLGRDRAVVVPRLPDRGDEIGLLARAISDMTSALRKRIDAVETFAADVAHEIKNPLASLRSALESLEKIEDAELRSQLTAIAAHDVQRIDRLVTEIAEASRIDAQLSRATFEPVDLALLTETLVAARNRQTTANHCNIALTFQNSGPFLVSGDPSRLMRVFANLLDNAVSFSPDKGEITISFSTEIDKLRIEVIDSGPGIPIESREKIFERFHSWRPENEDFGQHSGLGLAIARTIIEAHEGSLTAHNRHDGLSGARMLIILPLFQPEFEPEL